MWIIDTSIQAVWMRMPMMSLFRCVRWQTGRGDTKETDRQTHAIIRIDFKPEIYYMSDANISHLIDTYLNAQPNWIRVLGKKNNNNNLSDLILIKHWSLTPLPYCLLKAFASEKLLNACWDPSRIYTCRNILKPAAGHLKETTRPFRLKRLELKIQSFPEDNGYYTWSIISNKLPALTREQRQLWEKKKKNELQ